MRARSLLLAGLIGLTSLAVLPAPSEAANEYGALAYGRKNGALGWSYNYDDEDEARRRAMEECEKYASDCKIARTFTDVCVTVARAGNRMGWAWGYEKAERRRRAIAECRKDGGRNCKVEANFCTGEGRD